MKQVDMPLVSIITPVYNGEKYIEKTIETILSSSYKNIELVLVNDGSKDSSLEICKSYEYKDSRVKVIDKANGGIFDARNAALEVIRGEYFTFVDQDDLLHPDGIRHLVQTIMKDDSDMVVGSLATFYGNQVFLSNVIDDKVAIGQKEITDKIIKPILIYTDHIDSDSYIKGWDVLACLFKKEIQIRYSLKFRRFIDYEDDLIFYVDYADKADKISFTHNIVYLWRCNLRSESHSYKYISEYWRRNNNYQHYVKEMCEKRGISHKEVDMYLLDSAGICLIRYMDSIICNKSLSNSKKVSIIKKEINYYKVLEKMRTSGRKKTNREKLYFFFLDKNMYSSALILGNLSLLLSKIKAHRMKKYGNFKRKNLNNVLDVDEGL